MREKRALCFAFVSVSSSKRCADMDSHCFQPSRGIFAQVTTYQSTLRANRIFRHHGMESVIDSHQSTLPHTLVLVLYEDRGAPVGFEGCKSKMLSMLTLARTFRSWLPSIRPKTESVFWDPCERFSRRPRNLNALACSCLRLSLSVWQAKST